MMSRSPRSPSRLSFDAQGSFLEERSKTFTLPSRRAESGDGASEIDYSAASDMDHIVSLVNNRFERKERQIKKEMREEFEKRLQKDSRHNDHVISVLKRDLSHLTKISHEFDGLKEVKKSLQHEVNVQHEKIVSMRDENSQLKANVVRLQGLCDEYEGLRVENETLKKDKTLMEVRIVKLKATVTEKEQEVGNLKLLIDSQYKRIKLDLSNTRDKFYNEQETIQKNMKQQHVMLTEISEAVKNLSGDGTGASGSSSKKQPARSTLVKSTRSPVVRVKPFIGASTSLNKLTLDDSGTSRPIGTKKKH